MIKTNDRRRGDTAQLGTQVTALVSSALTYYHKLDLFFLSTSGGLAPLALIHLGLHGIALPLIPEDLRVTVRHIHWTYITDMYMGHYENWPDNQFSHHSWYANSSLCYHHHHTCVHMVFHRRHRELNPGLSGDSWECIPLSHAPMVVT